MSKTDGILDLILTHEWFDKIKNGKKKVEYRRQSAWINKIYNRYKGYKTVYEDTPAVSCVRLSRGYSRTEQMLFKIKKIELLKTGIKTDLKTNEPTYAIYLGKLLKYAQFCSKSEES